MSPLTPVTRPLWSAPGHSGGPRSPYCRLTVLAPHRRADLAVPADLPVAELVPMLLDLLGTGPVEPVPWQLSSAAGAVLAPAATLDDLGVLDGDVLRLRPVTPAPPAPLLDDPVDALARAGEGPAAPTTSGHRFRTGMVVALAAAAAALLGGVRSAGPSGALPVVAAVLLAAAVALAGVVVAARRAHDDAGLGRARTAVLAALPPAAAAGWVALPGPVGAGHVLLAAAAVGTVAAAGQVAVRVVTPMLVATVLAAAASVLGGLAGLLTGAGPAAVGAVAAAAAIAAGPLLPRLAVRLAGLPRPVVPADAAELVGAGGPGMPPEELADRAELARGLLVGAIAGTTVVAAAGAVLAASVGWVGLLLGVVVAVVLGLRSRGVTDPAAVRSLHAGAVVAALGVALPAALVGGSAARIGVAAGLLVGAALVATSARPVERHPSPVLRRAVDLVEMGLVALALPLALGAAGLYALVHGR